MWAIYTYAQEIKFMALERKSFGNVTFITKQHMTLPRPVSRTMMASIMGQCMVQVFFKAWNRKHAPHSPTFWRNICIFHQWAGKSTPRPASQTPTHIQQLPGWKHGSQRPHLDPQLTSARLGPQLLMSDRDVHRVGHLTEETSWYYDGEMSREYSTHEKCIQIFSRKPWRERPFAVK